MIILELRPGVKVKVTVTRKQCTTLRDPKVYRLIKYGNPTSNNIDKPTKIWLAPHHLQNLAPQRMDPTDRQTHRRTVKKIMEDCSVCR